MTRNQLVEIIFEDIKTNMARFDLVTESELFKVKKDELNQLWQELLEKEKDLAAVGFKVGFDFVMILYGLPPKYYSIWPEDN